MAVIRGTTTPTKKQRSFNQEAYTKRANSTNQRIINKWRNK